MSDMNSFFYSTSRAHNSPTSYTSNLESPRAKSPPTLALTTSSPSGPNSLRQPDTDLTDGNTSSGATTPTTSANDRKSKSLLGLYPLTGFLRVRYPSVVGRPSVKSVAETPEVGFEDGDASAVGHPSSDEVEGTTDDDEDRRTIRGVDIDDEVLQEGKPVTNGHGTSNGARSIEKSLHQTAAPLPTPTSSTVVSNTG